MENIAALTQQYGYWVIFLGMVASAFLPIPGELVLLIGGALAFSGRLEPGAVLGLAVAGLAIGDTLLYWLGRKIGVRRERQLVAVYCRWASCTLGSVYCHEAARSYVARFKGSVLVIGKFMPGVGRFIPPVAGNGGDLLSNLFAPGRAGIDALGRDFQRARVSGSRAVGCRWLRRGPIRLDILSFGRFAVGPRHALETLQGLVVGKDWRQ